MHPTVVKSADGLDSLALAEESDGMKLGGLGRGEIPRESK
jgi:hypothetical protein